MEIMKLYEQSKAMNAAQVRAANNDSGISSTPSSAGGSVSSTDTNHGGSEEDLINFNQSWRHSKYDNWPPGEYSNVLQFLATGVSSSLILVYLYNAVTLERAFCLSFKLKNVFKFHLV